MLNSTLAGANNVNTPGDTTARSQTGDDAAHPGSGPADLDRLRAQVDQLQRQQRELMELLGTSRPERLAHDLRNLLQERVFLEAAVKRFGV
jgi:hypothetical protein